jgi:glycerol uptake facilitator-like aquaporin
MAVDLQRRLTAEALGTALLVAAVVGSGIMVDRLTGDSALALLCNAIATGAILFVLISILGPLSSAHLNPAVTMTFALRRDISISTSLAYVAAQIVGGVAGTMLAHAMFDLSILQMSQTVRTGAAQWLAEAVATFGLLLTIFGGLRFRADAVPSLVALYITSAYWFTASTSFANPAVTIARSFTNTFSGIRLADVPGFVMVQLISAVIAGWFAAWLFAERHGHSSLITAQGAD